MRRFLGTWVAGCIALCACTGCDHEATSYQCRPVDVDGWEQFDTLMFVVDSLPNNGIYALNEKAVRILEQCMEQGIARMRNFQRALVAGGLKLKAYPLGKILDVDHAGDIEKAEAFLNGKD